jgi:hypothetical protein
MLPSICSVQVIPKAIAATTMESSVGKKGSYYLLYKPPPETKFRRTMNNFATLISCTAEVGTSFFGNA